MSARNLAQSMSGMSSNETLIQKQTKKSRRSLFKQTCVDKNSNKISNPPSVSDEGKYHYHTKIVSLVSNIYIHYTVTV